MTEEEIKLKAEVDAKRRATKLRPYSEQERRADKLKGLYYKIFQETPRAEIDALCADLNEVLGLNPPLDLIEKSEDVYVKSLVLSCSFVDAKDTLTEESWYLLFAHGLLLTSTRDEYIKLYGLPKFKPLPPSKEYKKLVHLNQSIVQEVALKPRIPPSGQYVSNKNAASDFIYEFVYLHAKSGFTQKQLIAHYHAHHKFTEDYVNKLVGNFLSDGIVRNYNGVIVYSQTQKDLMYAILPQVRLTLKEMEVMYESNPRTYFNSATKPESSPKTKKRASRSK